MTKNTHIVLAFAVLAASASAKEYDYRDSAVEYARALKNVERIAAEINNKMAEVQQIDQGIESTQKDIQTLKRQAESLRQEAQDVQSAANEAASAASANQSPAAGSGGGGSGAGGGGGAKGGGMEGKEPPKLGEAPKFEMPPAVAEQANLSDIMSKLGFNPGRGIGAGSPTEFTGSTFDPSAFRLKNGSQEMTSFTPGNVASGNLPQLKGATSVGNPIADQNAAAAAAASTPGPTPGQGGQGMMGGAGIGANNSAGGGDVSGGDAREEDEGPSPKINTETMATGTGGDGAEGGASVSTTGDADESPVGRQKSTGGDTIIVASERGVVNPEARGLMTYVGTGFVKELCSLKNTSVGVCLGPLPQTLAAAEAPEAEVEVAGRALASVPDVSPAQASVGAPQRSERRAGILGLLSGK